MKKNMDKIKPFDSVRGNLENQCMNVSYISESGLSKEGLASEFKQKLSEMSSEPRIIIKAELFKLLCLRAAIAPEPNDFFVGKIEHHKLLIRLKDQWLREETEKEFGDDSAELPGTFFAQLDCSSHICPDWENLLKLGIKGIRDRAARKTGDFYQAIKIVFDGVTALLLRFDKLQPELGLAALTERPPQSLQEALQLAYIYHELVELDGIEIRSMGRFDHIYNKYYMNDLQTGRLTRDSAKELLKYFWIKFFAKTMGKRFGKPFTFGPDANELAYTAIEAYHEMHIVDPKFHIRLSPETPDDFQELIAECIRNGCTGIVIVNNDAQINMLVKNGKNREDAENYILIGCYEPAVMGKELNCSGAGALNLAKPVEQLFSNDTYSSFEHCFEAYLNYLNHNLELQMETIRRLERLWPQVNPSPLCSGLLDSCLESNLDISEAGAEYNTSGICCAGLANAVDSLAVIRQFVYKEKRCDMRGLQAALAADWNGYEELRLEAVRKVPKWGNNNKFTDELAIKITNYLGMKINSEPNARGGVFQAALYGIIEAAKMLGNDTGALPDGYRAGTPLTMNTGATPGRDRNGLTSLINSVTKINLELFPNGTVLDIMLHPTAVSGRKGIATIISIIKSLFIRGGMALQFNIFDSNELRNAQTDPEKYANLQVRVCGWNVRFIDLPPDQQEIFIAKAEIA